MSEKALKEAGYTVKDGIVSKNKEIGSLRGNEFTTFPIYERIELGNKYEIILADEFAEEQIKCILERVGLETKENEPINPNEIVITTKDPKKAALAAKTYEELEGTFFGENLRNLAHMQINVAEAEFGIKSKALELNLIKEIYKRK